MDEYEKFIAQAEKYWNNLKDDPSEQDYASQSRVKTALSMVTMFKEAYARYLKEINE